MEQARSPKRGNNGTDDAQKQTAAYSGARQPDPFAGADPLAPTDPFADLLDLSFSRALLVGQTPAAVNSTAPEVPAVTNISADPQLTSSGRKASSPVVEDGISWGLDPLATSEGSLAAKKRKAQESRLKRDQFLNQMSSFLEGIESNTADIVPPEPPVSFASVDSLTTLTSRTPDQPRPSPESTVVEHVDKQSLWPNASKDGPHGASLAFPPEASKIPLLNSAADCSGSSLMREDLYEDPFVASEPPRQTPLNQGDLYGAIGTGTNPHPRGSLFDDDVDPEEEYADAQNGETQREGGVVASVSTGTPPQRVSPSPLPFSAPPQDARGAQPQARPRRKAKPSRGMDLGEVRRRTSLLSGEAREPPVPVRAPTISRSTAPRPTDTTATHQGLAWRRQEALAPPSSPSVSGEMAHPLYAATAADPLLFGGGRGGKFDDRGNYFNEDLLLARAQGSKAKYLGPLEDRSGDPGRGIRGGDKLRDSAGEFFNSARDGAKTLIQDAKAGVGAVGASVGWTSSHEESGQASHERGRQPRRMQQDDTNGAREFEATFGEGRLGFTLFREETGRRKGKGVVCRVHPGSTAQTLGVQLGDTVCGINKRRYGTYDEVMEVLPKLPRPVLISFTREGPGQAGGSPGGLAAAARLASSPSKDSQGGGGNPLEWLAKLNPFDKQRREEEEEQRAKRNHSLDAAPVRGSSMPSSERRGLPGEVFAQDLQGGVFSWSYYGTSDGIEANTRDTYTEHVMRCQWGRTADTMQSWMVARRYREFDALDLDLRDTYPDRRDALPRLPPKEFFKMAPDVVERRTKGLEVYITTIIRRFPDMLESSHLDRFLTISERLSGMKTSTPVTPAGNGSGQAVSYRTLGPHGFSANVFPASDTSMDAVSARTGPSSLVGTEYILNLMSSEEAYRLSQARHSDPVDVSVAERLVGELEGHLSSLSPTAHLLSDAKLYGLVERCQKCWPRIKAAAAAAASGESSGNSEGLLPRLLQCDEGMERAFRCLGAALASRGYIGGAP